MSTAHLPKLGKYYVLGIDNIVSLTLDENMRESNANLNGRVNLYIHRLVVKKIQNVNKMNLFF